MSVSPRSSVNGHHCQAAEHPVIWVSSTAVFGQHQTGILDESVPVSPDHWRGQLLWEAEQNIAQIKAPQP